MEAGSHIENLGLFRMRLLCHIAFGVSQGKKAVCPLHFPGIQVRLVKARGSRNVLQVVSSDASAETALRELIRRVMQ